MPNIRRFRLEALKKLLDEGHPMYLIAIKPIRMDILFSSFKKDGYSSRQTLEMKS